MSVHEETLTATTTCKNCETTFEGKFCSNCAQKADTHRFTIKHFAHEAFHAFTHTDKGILFLIKKLFRWPGIVAREYVEGKRKKYFDPITFLLITMAIQIYVLKKTDFYNVFIDETGKLIEKVTTYDTSKKIKTDSMTSLQKAKVQTSKTMENSRIITFVFVPFLAMLTWLFFKKSGFNYVENLMMGIFVQGQLNLLFLFFCIVPFLIYKPLVVFILYAYTVVIWAYSLLAYRQFFRQRKWATIWKGSVVQILYFLAGQQLTSVLVDYL